MRKFPRLIRLKDRDTSKIPAFSRVRGGDANTLSSGWQKHWARILLAAAVAILGLATVLVACGPVSNNTPVASVPTVAIDSTTPTIDTSPTPTARTTPAVTSGLTPTPDLTIHPTTVPATIPPTSHPGPVPTPTPVPTPVPTPTPTPTHPSGKTVTVWIQVTDSCEQALSGATFTVSGPGINTTTSATSGGSPVSIGTTGGCPTQQGTCVATSTGCTSIALNIPSSGTATYKIIVARTATGFGTNVRYAICQGGSDCPHGPEVATVLVGSGGSVSATVLNIYPDGVLDPWPTNKSAYSGTQGDPVLFHEFGIAAKSTASNQCDGDYDADDYLTGGRGVHCDSDKGSPGS